MVSGNKYFIVQNSNDIKYLTKKAEKSGLVAILLMTSGNDPFSDVIHNIWVATGENEPVSAIEMHVLIPQAKQHLQKLFYTKEIKKVFFDSILDQAFLRKQGFKIDGKKFDVSLASQLLFAGLSKGKPTLGGLIQYYIDENTNLSISLEECDYSGQKYYNQIAERTTDLLSLREILIDDLQKDELIEVADLEFESASAVVQLWLNGIGVDSEKLTAAHTKWKEDRLQFEKEIQDLFNNRVDINNSESLKKNLNTLPQLKLRKIHLENTKNATLKHYGKSAPILQRLLNYNQVKFFMDAAAQLLRFMNPDTGRVYPFYDPLGAATGRFSCSRPALQNMPKNEEIRCCFTAGNGKKFVIADYSQIELRIAAEISGDIEMITAFKNDIDFHSLTAAIITGNDIDSITTSERKAAKCVNFGIIYGMGPKGLCDYAFKNYDIELTVREAEKFQRDFFDKYSGLHQWRMDQASLNPPETRTLAGRIRRWKDDWASEPELLNTPIQGTAADIIKNALWMLSDWLIDTDTLLVGCIHDEIIIEVDENRADTAAKELSKIMENAGTWYLADVPIVVDVEIADHWS